MKRRYTLPILLLLVLAVPSAWAQTFFTATLSPSQAVHDVTSDATGTAALVLTESGLRFVITVEGLSGEIAAAHFHRAPLGVNGGVVRPLTDDFDGGTAVGIWTADDAEPLTDELRRALLAGELYVNVHTAAYGGGELRGQVRPSAGAGLRAALTPAQEPGTVESDGAGTAALQATAAGVLFYVTVDGLTGDMAAAHFHDAPTGTNGGVVRGITDDFDGNTAFGLWTADDDQPLTPELLEKLLTGGLYLNVHTAAYGGGEIRGQVVPAGGWGFSARLDAEQQTADVTSDGTGTAAFTLTERGLAYRITVDGLTGEVAAAHFHRAPAGQSGGVVRTLTDDFDGGTAVGLWTADDDEPFTTDLLRALLAGELYVNVHTAAYSGGEIRGQVLRTDGTYMAAGLTAAAQAHDVTSDAAGTAALRLTDDGLAFDLTVTGLSGDVAAAHFHRGATGVAGGVVRTITGDFDGNTASGLWTAADDEPLSAELMQALLAGELYLNVHTADNPQGEIRGQVRLGGGTSLRAALTSAQEVHDVTQAAHGTAALTLTPHGLAFDLTVTGLSGDLAAAHFHHGATGVAGGVVRTITDDFGGGTARGVWTADDAEALTGALRDSLLAGRLYLNVHTAANPQGEIRGQVVPSGGIGAAVQLDPAQETHDVESDAGGTAALTLTDAGLLFDVTVAGLSGPLSAAHFHQAPLGTNGGVFRTLTDDFDGNTAAGVWRASDAEPLTAELTQALLSGDLYVNVHTPTYGAGEVRGQVRPNTITVTSTDPSGGDVPRAFTLEQNYPNPFNPATRITFSLARSAEAVLVVYNALGQRVATLVDGVLPSGRHEVTFDGRGLPSGVYLYRLEADGARAARTMLLLK